MPRRIRTTAKVVQAARRNIKRAQLARLGTRETRSVGRVMRSRLRYSRPDAGRIRIPTRRRTR